MEQAIEAVAEAEAAITEAVTTIAASTADLPTEQEEPALDKTEVKTEAKVKTGYQDSSAPLCYNCGNQTMRSGNCYVCTACGSTTGCS